jgi:hypothetical protein
MLEYSYTVFCKDVGYVLRDEFTDGADHGDALKGVGPVLSSDVIVELCEEMLI